MFEVNNFHREIKFQNKNDSEDEAEQSALDIKIDREYRRLTIKVYPAFFENSPERQANYIVHELCHVVIGKVTELSRNILIKEQFVTWREVKEANEHVTQQVTDIVTQLMSGNLTYAKKAYKNYIRTVTPKVSKKKRC